MDSPPLTVLVVCRWSILGAGLQRAISAAWPDAAVVVVDGALGALAATSATRFDLAVVEAELAGVCGAVASHVVRSVSPETVCVLLVERVTDAVTLAAIAHGVAALIPTASTGPGLVGLARQALAGARPLDTVLLERPDLAASLFDDVRSAALDEAVYSLGLRALPPIEVAILDGLIRGLPPGQIAAQLADVGSLAVADIHRVIGRLDGTTEIPVECRVATVAAA